MQIHKNLEDNLQDEEPDENTIYGFPSGGSTRNNSTNKIQPALPYMPTLGFY